jgi:hypothetical protein
MMLSFMPARPCSYHSRKGLIGGNVWLTENVPAGSFVGQARAQTSSAAHPAGVEEGNGVVVPLRSRIPSPDSSRSSE